MELKQIFKGPMDQTIRLGSDVGFWAKVYQQLAEAEESYAKRLQKVVETLDARLGQTKVADAQDDGNDFSSLLLHVETFKDHVISQRRKAVATTSDHRNTALELRRESNDELIKTANKVDAITMSNLAKELKKKEKNVTEAKLAYHREMASVERTKITMLRLGYRRDTLEKRLADLERRSREARARYFHCIRQADNQMALLTSASQQCERDWRDVEMARTGQVVRAMDSYLRTTCPTCKKAEESLSGFINIPNLACSMAHRDTVPSFEFEEYEMSLLRLVMSKLICQISNSSETETGHFEIKDVICDYHRRGYQYRLIHYLLEKRHNCVISFSYLQKKVIPSLGLKRRGKIEADFDNIIRISSVEISNGLAGSEQLRRTLSVKYNIRIPREFSRQLVRCLDEEGVKRRKANRLRRRLYISKGPNYAWHLDGYDKLAPYGIYIHACIDGFSRKIMWLNAGVTNRRPEVIADYFLDAVDRENGFPRLIRGDHGTENTLVARLIRNVNGTDSAFLYGKSTSNQRIERWWGHLRKARSDFWINELKEMERDGVLNKDNPVQKLCLQYAFLPFVKKQLADVETMWNCHLIRPQKKGDTVAGIPEILHSLVELHDYDSSKVRCCHVIKSFSDKRPHFLSLKKGTPVHQLIPPTSQGWAYGEAKSRDGKVLKFGFYNISNVEFTN